MKRLLYVLLAALFGGSSLLVTACTTATGDDDDASDDDDAADDDDATEDPCAGDDDDAADPPTGNALMGQALGPDGTAYFDVALTACQGDRCLFGRTDCDGNWVIDGLDTGHFVVHNIAWPGDDQTLATFEWSSFYTLANLGDGEQKDLGVLHYPKITESFPAGSGPQSLSFGGGAVTLEYDADELDYPFPASESAAPTIGAVQVPEADYPREGYEGWEILDAWAFSPFETPLETAAGAPGHFSATVDLGAAPADPTALSLLYANYEEDINTGVFGPAENIVVDGQTISGDFSHAGLLLVVRQAL